LEALAAEIQSDGGEAHALPTDLRERMQIITAVQQTLVVLDSLDSLVNNAGVEY
jgi:NADP-dependent 3-hydroxy acid dehydrogenase YdfG